MADAGQHRHPCPSAGGWRTDEKRGQKAQGLGCSRGGFSTKSLSQPDGSGNPCRFRRGRPGKRHGQGARFVDGIKPDALLADRAHDADRLMDVIPMPAPSLSCRQGVIESISMPATRGSTKSANVIERFFNKLKQSGRVATRCDKLLNNLMGFVKIASIPRCFVTTA
ncbi:MAG: hypothetical protein R3F54_07395 [Alphaproteobacteria bacterium]